MGNSINELPREERKKNYTDMQKAQVMLFQPRRARRKQGGCKFIICCLRDLRVLCGEITSGPMQLELSR